MDAKKVASFLLLRPAFSGRNLTSLILVMVFFGVYVASGGRVTTIPKVKTGPGFGTVDAPAIPQNSLDEKAPTSNEKPRAQPRSYSRGMLFGGRNQAKKEAPVENQQMRQEEGQAQNADALAPRDRMSAMREKLNRVKEELEANKTR